MIDRWLVVMRGVQFAACMLLASILAFRMLIAGGLAPKARQSAGTGRRLRPLGALLPLLLAAALASGAGWLLWVAQDMAGVSLREAMRSDVLGTVWRQTHFGFIWQLRAYGWLFVSAALLAGWIMRRLIAQNSVAAIAADACAMLGSFFLLGSLAWAGHGQCGPYVKSHLVADVVHLVSGAFWPGALLPFGWTVWRLQRGGGLENWRLIELLTRRFSASSLCAVSALGLSGVANGYFLVGSFSDLWHSRYGQVLSAKIIVFLIMVAIGAVNLLRLKPRVGDDERAVTWIRRNVTMEFVGGMIVVCLVAVLGLLPPTAMEMAM